MAVRPRAHTSCSTVTAKQNEYGNVCDYGGRGRSGRQRDSAAAMTTIISNKIKYDIKLV